MSDKSAHSFAPVLPVQNNPLFSWPLDLRAVGRCTGMPGIFRLNC